jgi:hypothetical protein
VLKTHQEGSFYGSLIVSVFGLAAIASQSITNQRAVFCCCQSNATSAGRELKCQASPP